MSGVAYETLRPVTPFAGVVLAANPDPMTLDGTNTWLLRSPDSTDAIVIDPGPDDPRHLTAVATAAGAVSQILLTHGHLDHSAGARRLHAMTGAPVRALDPRHRLGGEGLTEGAVVADSGVELQVLATPGHTSDSLCFLLDPGSPLDGGDSSKPAVLTGDTVLGRGTTVVAYPDGDLGSYLASLRRLRALGDVVVLPGHGAELASAAAAASAYLAHREERLEQVRVVVAELGGNPPPRAVVERVYADVARVLWPAAELSVRAQLAYLRGSPG